MKFKKSLGQNLLVDKNVLKKILSLTSFKNKKVIEIGSGTGNLSIEILKLIPKKLICIEKDKAFAKNLKILFKNEKNLSIINEDILKINEDSICNEKLVVFGNLPYNISTEILCKWILNLKNEKIWFSNLILMFQKEVAERIISKYDSSKYGRLSILANWRLNIKKIIDIKPNCFYPKPKVDSTLLFFSLKKSFFSIKDPSNLEKITRVFFNQRRKMIKKPYNQLFSGNLYVSNKLKLNLNYYT